MGEAPHEAADNGSLSARGPFRLSDSEGSKYITHRHFSQREINKEGKHRRAVSALTRIHNLRVHKTIYRCGDPLSSVRAWSLYIYVSIY
jgi:hypothetical protein